ncbi:dihydrodipicolinate synthase family protein [Alkalispirochaeta sphaeroplastigenens]|nr:dihydrodipicolinate synthase family protein [Alkalispirochaeta sphaeroplastigenens]
MKKFKGCWPTMITPFTEDNRIDYPAVERLVEWYVQRGCDGIFAVCQSSEMFFLAEDEKKELAKAVVSLAGGRVKVVASGHTAEDPSEQIDQIMAMSETGVDAVVLVSNRLADPDQPEELFQERAEAIFAATRGVPLGMYECPYPKLRLLDTAFLRDAAHAGKLVFLKDVSCSGEILQERIQAVAGSGLALLNANTATLLDSLIAGADGYNGVMGNFHIDLYKWLYDNFRKEPGLAREVSDFLTVSAIIEARAYPVSAKHHFNITGVPMETCSRALDSATVLNENGLREINSLIRMESALRHELGLPS